MRKHGLMSVKAGMTNAEAVETKCKEFMTHVGLQFTTYFCAGLCSGCSQWERGWGD